MDEIIQAHTETVNGLNDEIMKNKDKILSLILFYRINTAEATIDAG